MTRPRAHADLDAGLLADARQHNRQIAQLMESLTDDRPLSHQQYYHLCTQIMAELSKQATALEKMNEIRLLSSGRHRRYHSDPAETSG